MQQRVEQAAAIAERVEHPVGDAGAEQPAQRRRERDRQLSRDRLDHHARHGRDVNGEPAAVDPLEQPPQRAHRASLDRHRAVARAPAQARPRPADLLLGDHDRIEGAPGDVHAERAELADGVAHPLEQLGVLAHEELGAERAARLLVGHQAEDHVARRPAPGCLRAHERRQHHRHAALHVERAAPPHEAVVLLTGERRVAPASGGGDDVDVSLQQQRRRAALALQARDEARPVGLGCHDLHLAAQLLEQPAHPVDALALVAGRVGRVEAQQPREQLGGAILDRSLGGRRRRAHRVSVSDRVIAALFARANSW